MSFDVRYLLDLSDLELKRLIEQLSDKEIEACISMCDERIRTAEGSLRSGSLQGNQIQLRNHVISKCKSIITMFQSASFNRGQNRRASRTSSMNEYGTQELLRVRNNLAKYKGCFTGVDSWSIIGLCTNGSVVVMPPCKETHKFEMATIATWRNIVAVAGSYNGIYVGVKASGEVVACSEFYSETYAQNSGYYGRSNILAVDNWKDVISVDVSYNNIVGLKSDGTVLLSKNEAKDCKEKSDIDVSEWSDIVSIAAASGIVVGLRKDGTVVGAFAHGKPDSSFEFSRWRNIVAIATTWPCTLGLTADGTVVAIGSHINESRGTELWRDIVAIEIKNGYSVGLRADGIVVLAAVPVGELWENREKQVEQWRDIVAIASAGSAIAGLMADGTVVYTNGELTNIRNIGPASLQEMTALEQKDQQKRKKAFAHFATKN